MRDNWHGLIKILEAKHIRNGEVIWEDKNIYNVFHTLAEKHILDVMFAGESLSTFYYAGLDNRTTLAAADDIDDLVEEPTVNGYRRQSVSASGFTVAVNDDGVYRALSPIVTFTATGSGWGPVQNLFMATKSDSTGVLLGSALLSQSLIMDNGDSFSVRMGLSLRDYSS